MPRERVAMRKIREILRLVWACNQSRRDAAKSCGVGKSTVNDTINRAVAAGLSWPFEFDDESLEKLLYPPPIRPSLRKLTQPDWQSLHDELARNKNLTLMLLWQEYKEMEPSGYQYSQFCELYRQWRKKLDHSMRQEHRAGEKFFVDYSGQTVEILDSATGEVREAQMFVGVMGGSNQTYAVATWTQSLPDWIGSDIHPAAVIGRGILIDHGSGVVIGETAVVGDNVSILHEVTLGGTGKEGGDRHPKVESGVMIGAGAKIL